MFKLGNIVHISIEKLKVALTTIKNELSIIGYACKYGISPKEARKFKKWCRQTYYYKSYKTSVRN